MRKEKKKESKRKKEIHLRKMKVSVHEFTSQYKSKNKAMTGNLNNHNQNPVLETKTGNNYIYKLDGPVHAHLISGPSKRTKHTQPG